MESDWPRAFAYITWERFSQSMWFLQNHKDNYGGLCKPKDSTLQGYPYWGVIPTSQKFAHSPPPRKMTPTKLLFTQPPLAPNNNFQVITQQNSIYSCRHCSCSIAWISYSLDKQVMLILILIDVQYSQKAVFSFKKGSNHQNHSSSGSFDPVKKFPQ